MKKSILASSIILASLILPLEAKAVNFSSLYVFGDSLSDTGNVYNASGNNSPPPPYSNGRFSNDKIWVEYLANDLGLSAINYLAGGTNFAFGGATTGTANTINNALPGVQGEIGLFRNFLGSNPANPNALYLLWAGSNDYLPTNSSDFTPYPNPDQTITNLTSEITTLAQLGAKNILVVNLPDLGKTPRANNLDPTLPVLPGTASRLTTISNNHNTQLASALNTLKPTLPSDVNLIPFDINTLFNEVLGNANSFGFTNTTNGCVFTTACVLGNLNQQNQYFFWDGLHPTTAVHQIIGKAAFNLVNVPESSNVFSLFTFGILGTGLSWKRHQKKVKSNQDKAA